MNPLSKIAAENAALPVRRNCFRDTASEVQYAAEAGRCNTELSITLLLPNSELLFN
jgi:hypothetical protein